MLHDREVVHLQWQFVTEECAVVSVVDGLLGYVRWVFVLYLAVLHARCGFSLGPTTTVTPAAICPWKFHWTIGWQ